MSLKIDSEKVAEILKYINDKDSFILELVLAINQAIEESNIDIIENCLDEWEESAELNSIGGFSDRVQRRYNLLVEAGLINEK